MPDQDTPNTTSGTDPKGALAMPSRHELVAEAVARLDTLGLRSKVIDIDTATLQGLCLRLTDRTVTVADAHKWLNKELGADVEKGDPQVVDDNAVYRFADHFRRIYGQVRREHANRLARLTVDHATDSNIQNMTRVARSRLAELTAEKLVGADDLDDLNRRDIAAALDSVQMSLKAEYDTARLDLARKQAEDRAVKLEAEVERLTLENDKRRSELQRSIEAAKKDVQSAVEGKANKSMTEDQVIAILDRVMKGEAS